MKKYFLFLYGIIIMFQNLDGQSLRKFTLSGSISNLDSGKLYLKYWDEGKKTVDSTEIKDRKFIFTGVISEPVMASLADGIGKMYDGYENYYTDFYIEPGDMQVSLINHHFAEAKITGSKADEEYKDLNEKALPLFEVRNSLKKTLRENSIDNNSINDSLQLINVQIKKVLFAFINNHRESVISIKAMGWLDDFSIDKDSIIAMLNSLPQSIKNTYSANWLKKIEENKGNAVFGSEAPDFNTIDMNGKEIHLRNFRGKYILLDFWASWCIPCRAINPDLKKMYSIYHEKGLDIISISTDENISDWKKAILKGHANAWYQIRNSDWSINNRYNVVAIPHLILIDKKGKIIGKYKGRDEVKKNLKEKLVDTFGEQISQGQKD